MEFGLFSDGLWHHWEEEGLLATGPFSLLSPLIHLWGVIPAVHTGRIWQCNTMGSEAWGFWPAKHLSHLWCMIAVLG